MADSRVTSQIRGLEILFSTCKHDLQSQNDALICFLHSFMISKGLKCVGHGEEGEDIRKTELLPGGWNSCQDVYVLRYQADDAGKYVLKVVKMDDVLLVHFLRLSDDHVSSMTIKTNDFTTAHFTDFDRVYRMADNLEKKFKAEVWDEMMSPPKSSRSTETRSRTEERPRSNDPSHDPLRVGPVRGGNPMPPDWVEQGDPFSVGRGDLDPFGGHPGGMLMDPMRQGGRPGFGMDPNAGLPGRLPRGAVPPGARFDPFGPPGLGRGGPGRPGPDPDHMRPPDYDDMFM